MTPQMVMTVSPLTEHPPVQLEDIASAPIDIIVERLVRSESVDRLFDLNLTLGPTLMARVQRALNEAFVENDLAVRRQVHSALYLLYRIALVKPDSIEATNQFSTVLIRLRTAIEDAWNRFELARVKITPADIPVDTQEFIEFFKAHFATNAAGDRLFRYLEHEASRDEIVAFFRSDCPLNMLFFDLVAMSLVGVNDGRRQEIVGNLWDESGRGVERDSHTALFARVLDYVGEPCDPHEAARRLNWEGLAGYNLYMYFALHRSNGYRSLGNMAATELMDPEFYTKLLNGCRRVGLSSSHALAYYSEHVSQDVEHGDGWMQNVIAPTLAHDPARRYDIVVGAAMRMHTSADYYDRLHATLTSADR